LLDVLGCDGTSISWGPYSLYSDYGHSSNMNCVLNAHMISIQVESELAWDDFNSNLRDAYQNYDDSKRTRIMDGDKGMQRSHDNHFQKNVRFRCSRHLSETLLKSIGSGREGSDFYNAEIRKLDINEVILRPLPLNSVLPQRLPLSTKVAFKVFNGRKDGNMVIGFGSNMENVIPAARLSVNDNANMYGKTTQSFVESMNNADMDCRKCAGLDPVSSMNMLLSNWSRRCKSFQKECHSRDAESMFGSLTPYYAKELRETIDKAARLTISNGDVDVVDSEDGKNAYHVVLDTGDSVGSCECNIPRYYNKNCKHQVALARARGIPVHELAPIQFRTSSWRNQYPLDIEYFVPTSGEIKMLQKNENIQPPLVAPRKKGNPTLGHKRILSAIEKSKSSRPSKVRVCGKCGEVGHDKRTCADIMLQRMENSLSTVENANTNNNQ